MKNNSFYIQAIVFVVVLFTTSACNFFAAKSEEDKGKEIARVYDKYLYVADVESILPEGVSGNDSLAIVSNFINNWAKDQLMLYMAEYNLSEKSKNFDDQIENYKNDLLKFAYQQEYVKQRLDTQVTKHQIRNYYKKYKDNFLLHENIVQARYMVIPTVAPKLQEAKKWFLSTKAEDKKELRDYAIQNASEFLLEDTSWVSLDKIASKMLLEIENQESFLSTTKFIEKEAGEQTYWLEIGSYKTKDHAAPLSYVEEVIKSILLNKRKLELIETMEKSLLDNAIEKKEFQTY